MFGLQEDILETSLMTSRMSSNTSEKHLLGVGNCIIAAIHRAQCPVSLNLNLICLGFSKNPHDQICTKIAWLSRVNNTRIAKCFVNRIKQILFARPLTGQNKSGESTNN